MFQGFYFELIVPDYEAFLTLGGTIASFTAFATRNFTTFFAGILIASPVAGLRPMRAFLSTRTSRPMPGRMLTPFFLVSRTAKSAYASMKDFATLFGNDIAAASSFTICDWVIFAMFLL